MSIFKGIILFGSIIVFNLYVYNNNQFVYLILFFLLFVIYVNIDFLRKRYLDNKITEIQVETNTRIMYIHDVMSKKK